MFKNGPLFKLPYTALNPMRVKEALESNPIDQFEKPKK